MIKKVNLLVLTALIGLAFTACKNPSFVTYRAMGTVYSAVIDSVPPGKAGNEKVVHTYGSWEPKGMSISPDGKYVAIAQQKPNPGAGLGAPQFETEVRIYHILQNKLVKTYTQADLLALVNPKGGALGNKNWAFFIITINWMNNNSLYLNGQPDDPRVESVPQNVAFGFNAINKKLTHGPNFYSRANQPSLVPPVHPSKTKFSATLVNGQLQIQNQNVVNIRNGIEAFDIVFF